MYICICAGATETELKEIIKPDTTLQCLQKEGICDCCCKCKEDIEELLYGEDIN